jgi:hypothetical protein
MRKSYVRPSALVVSFNSKEMTNVNVVSAANFDSITKSVAGSKQINF